MVSTTSIVIIIIVIIIAIVVIGLIIYYKNSTTNITVNKKSNNVVNKKNDIIKPSIKYIKINNPENSILQIYKLKLIKDGKIIPLTVVSASQSYNPQENPPSAMLDYGNTNEKYFYHSIETPGAYVLLELTQSVNLPVTVIIENRKDCCEARMLGFRVALLDENSTIVEEKTIDKVEFVYTLQFADKI